MSGRVSLALVHYPVRGRDGATITTSITNLDVHDIARTARTYGVARYFIVTPIEAQRALVDHILGYWRDGDGARRVPERSEALSIVTAVPSLADAMAQMRATPLVVTTAASRDAPPVGFAPARERLAAEPGARSAAALRHGVWPCGRIARECGASISRLFVRDAGNHLAVRSAVAIVLDRLFGDAGA